MEKRGPGLEIEEDERYQRRFRLAQRVCWAAMGVFLAGALAGFTGPGLAEKTVASDGALSVAFDKFLRSGKEFRIVASLPSGPGAARLSIDRAYLERMQLLEVMPAPSEEVGRDRELELRFVTAGKGALRVSFIMKPRLPGRAEGSFAADGGTARVSQFVLP